MSNNQFFDDLMTSVNQAVAISKGEMEPARVTKIPVPDVKAIRAKAGYKQKDFAQLVGVSPSLVEAWEQHRRVPSGSALKILKMLENNPNLIHALKTA
ncbi:NadS family protein [Salmonella enterica]|uniref:HTH cro/C1-type domain-containing protein n=2 Tax=cellular organisms TaxID=131567 RepID=A0A0L0UNW2_9BASI|nr:MULTISPECIES: NadS family protein [Enterobacteriaceae]EDJ5190915.1 transcriptional regulator [Salmonella enterica subsp. enterica serovar Muenchen]EDL4061190.1 transcriptional regulator [Salmonella enterica subsp. enterica serovar Infantis]EDM5921962.1 transcriptional regulator [Salmonella enterica subsp. enterica serovar Litchfield]EDN0389092.1 transcriptional regulator [Salmonella enterica subsp. enterica serovar Newport]KNE88449.1 hypothetical protein PSTG_18150 [Puccinia striiformis f. 